MHIARNGIVMTKPIRTPLLFVLLAVATVVAATSYVVFDVESTFAGLEPVVAGVLAFVTGGTRIFFR